MLEEYCIKGNQSYIAGRISQILVVITAAEAVWDHESIDLSSKGLTVTGFSFLFFSTIYIFLLSHRLFNDSLENFTECISSSH